MKNPEIIHTLITIIIALIKQSMLIGTSKMSPHLQNHKPLWVINKVACLEEGVS